MDILQIIGRFLIAPLFIMGGWDTYWHTEPRIKTAQAAGAPAPDLTVKVNAAMMVGAGVMLLLGIFPRWAALLLAGLLVPTSLYGHQFWKKEGLERKQQQTHFLKNMAAMGGLLILFSKKKTECLIIEA